MKKLAITLLFATVAGALTFGAAASLPVTSQNLGSGGVGVVSCDIDGVSVSYEFVENEPQLVGAIVVSDIDEACLGQTLSWVLQTTESAVITAGSGIVDGPSSTFPLAEAAIAEEIGEVGITIAG